MNTWVLLRGLARETRHWQGLPARLQSSLPPGERVIALDLPGNGLLHTQRSPTGVEAMARAVQRELAARGEAGPFVALALSLGAMVALAWAAEPQSAVRGLVLLNSSLAGVSPPWHRLRPQSWLPLARIAASRRPEPAVLALTSHRRELHAALAQQWAAWQRERPVSLANAARQLLAAARFRPPPRPKPPGLLLASRDDRLVSWRCSLALAQRWGWPLDVHPWAGHDLALDDPDWVVQQVVRWAQGQQLFS